MKFSKLILIILLGLLVVCVGCGPKAPTSPSTVAAKKVLYDSFYIIVVDRQGTEFEYEITEAEYKNYRVGDRYDNGATSGSKTSTDRLERLKETQKPEEATTESSDNP